MHADLDPERSERIRQSIESADEDILAELPGLTPGQTVVAGDAMNTPVLVRIRERHIPHDTESPAARRTGATPGTMNGMTLARLSIPSMVRNKLTTRRCRLLVMRLG